MYLLHRDKVDSAGVSVNNQLLLHDSSQAALRQPDSSSQSVIDTLSKPISIYNADIVADEVAEIIAKHTLELRIDDSSNSSIASFKISGPVN